MTPLDMTSLPARRPPAAERPRLVEHSRAKVMAYCPLAHGEGSLLRSPELARLAGVRGCTPAQLALRWSLDRGHVPIPKASSRTRLLENLAALSLPSLSAAERAALDGLDADDGRVSFDPNLIA